MKNNEANLFVFIASIIIGLLISLTFNFNYSSNRIILDSKQYEDAYNEKNKLMNDISNLMDQYNVLYSKAQKYKNEIKDTSGVLDGIEEELYQSKLVLGTTAVEGEGIEITLKDQNFKSTDNLTQQEMKAGLVHDFDLINVVNDLRNAGAEAISINGQRVIQSTEILCGGPYVYINSVKVLGPFHISAIGSKSVLKEYMMMDQNYLKMLVQRKINVNVSETNKVQIPAYDGKVKKKYLKPSN